MSGGREGRSGLLAAVSAQNGEVIWKQNLPTYIHYPVAIFGEHLYFVNNAGNAFKVALADGTIQWETSIHKKTLTPTPVITDTEIIIGAGNNRECFSLSKNEGEINWTVETGVGGSIPIAISDSIIFGSANEGLFQINYSGEVTEKVEDVRADSPMAITKDRMYYKTAGISSNLEYIQIETN